MELEYLDKCPVCKQAHTKNTFIVCNDFTVSNEKFNLDECKSCGFVFTNPRPNAKTIGPYYNAESYISHTDSNKGLINKIYKNVRNITLKGKIDLINKYKSNKGRLLDIGTGTGYFISAAENNGWKVTGVEPDDSARKQAKSKINGIINQDLFCCFDESDSFDTITMWHVLEHVHLLEESLEKIKQILSPTGRLIVAVPNCESYDAAYYKEYWAAYDVPRHLYHFKKADINTLFARYGFEVVETKGMIFDSYYVSMLSEKYKNNGNSNLLTLFKAFMVGLKSNLNANGNNHSSLIYVLKKK